MNRLKLFRKQQVLREKLKGRPLLHKAVSRGEVKDLLDCDIDEARLSSFGLEHDFICSLDADSSEVKVLLAELSDKFNKERLENIFSKTQQDIIHSIAAPFGLGKMLGTYDKIGGNVDTVHNAREGIYATDEEKSKYEKRGEYNNDTKNTVHKHDNYIKNNKIISKARKSEGIQDGYTNKTLGRHDKVDQDHIISIKQTHDDAGRVLAGIKTEELANLDDNLTPTAGSINKSKQDKSPEKFASFLEKNASQRRERIEELEIKEKLTDQERKELNKLNQLESANPEQIREKGKIAQEAQDKVIYNEYYLSERFLKNSFGTSLIEGTKFGVQQAFGLLLIELFSSSFNEIKSTLKNGLEGESLYRDIKIRLCRVAKKLSTKWEDMILGFGSGFISGFISNIVTTIINVFVTTGRRLVRVIREGIFSLLTVVKKLLFPPKDMTYRESAHEAIKLLVSGGIVAGGIILEEVVEKVIMSIPFLVPLASMITTVIVGSIAVIAIALACYLIDKLDILNIIKIEEDQYIIKNLDNNIQRKLIACECMAEQIDNCVLTQST